MHFFDADGLEADEILVKMILFPKLLNEGRRGAEEEYIVIPFAFAIGVVCQFSASLFKKLFDFSSLPDPLSPENLMSASGRGIFLVRSVMDEFQVRRLDPAGTEVTLVKYMVSK